MIFASSKMAKPRRASGKMRSENHAPQAVQLVRQECEAHLHTSAYVGIRQHTSGIRQAYVSIRQECEAHLHTSAYVGIHQHASGIRQYTAGV